MDDGVTTIYVKQAQSVEVTTSSFEAETSQNAPPPYDQQFGTVQAAPVGQPYNQQLGTVQIAAAVCPPYSYDQQFGAVPAAPEGGYFNPSPVPDVTNTYSQQETHIVPVESPERDCYYYCFNCSKDNQWFDLRGKGLCWILLLLLLWITVGALMVAFFVVACAIVLIFGVHVKER